METHCVDLATEYVRRGISVQAVLPEGGTFDGLNARFESGGARVVRLTTDARDGRRAQLARLARLASILRTFKPTVVHLQTGGATGGFGVVALARALTPATVVLTEHDVPAERMALHDRAFKRVTDQLVHGLVAVSRRNAAIRRDRSGAREHRFGSILNGVPIPAVTGEERASNRAAVRGEMGIPNDVVVVGSVVRLANGKGLDDLMRAFAIVRREMATELLLVGDGPLRAELEALAAELGVSADVHFAGQRSNPGTFVDAMDVFVLAVPAGSMSIALLEAMARGAAPVITFCGPEEAVITEETGLGAPPADPSGLAAVLARIIRDDALRASLSRAAAAHVSTHFSVERVADDLLELYLSVSDGRVPARLRADGAPNPRPGSRQLATSHH
jgi:glycosyltransferase involved in cell wall biosynthesis